MPNDQVWGERPVPGMARSYRFPAVERHQTRNGIDVIVAPVTRVPLVTVQYVIQGGAIYEPAGVAGTAQLTAKGIAEGTEGLSGDSLAERFELLGSSAEPDAGWEAIELQNTVLPSRLAEVVSLAADVLISPAFREKDIARLRDERVAELMQRDAEPRELADDEFLRVLYSADSRLRLPLGGERATVIEFGASNAREWHSRLFRPERLAVIVTGDVQADDALSVVERTFGGWPAAQDVAVAVPSESRLIGPGTHFVSKAEAAQSEIRIGHTGPPRLHEDYFAITVLNAILGGLFGSRINLNLREAHGFTYGAFSGFSWRRDGSAFCVSTAVRSDATVRALKEVQMEIARIREEPVSASELSLAVDHLEGVFPIRFETTEALAAALATQRNFGLPSSYFDEYRDNIRAVSIADIQHAAQVHLRPTDLRTVIVGNATLQEELTEFTAGDVVVIKDPATGRATEH